MGLTEYVSSEPGELTIGDRVSQLAAQRPDRTVAIVAHPDGTESRMTWRELDQRGNAAARVLAESGVAPGRVVIVRLPMGHEHMVATVGAWKLAATVLPANPSATSREFDAVVQAARPTVVVAATPHPDVPTVPPDALWAAGMTEHRPAVAGVPRSAHATGGTTGRPRIIMRQPDWVYPPGGLPSARDRAIGLDLDQVQLVLLPLHHAGFTKLYHGLALGHTIVLLPRFDPERVPALIERHRVNYFMLVPGMMRRLLEVPALRHADISSVTTVHQSSAGAPAELKRRWMQVFPPETLYEGYSSQERIGALWIRGHEWLAHPGSVGRPVDCEVRIYLADGAVAPPGVIGEVFLRSRSTRQPAYVGDGPPLPERDGFLSIGDAGYLDDDGYLHIVGRTSEMINVDGVKVYPAEVEEVLLAHPDVVDVAVVARPHAVLGQAVHAVVVPADPGRPPRPADLRRHCAAQLSLAKVPLSYEFRSEIPRTEAGKLNRGALAQPEAGVTGVEQPRLAAVEGRAPAP